MNTGELREVVQILKPSRVKDETGQYVDGWELVATVRASKVESPGTETISGGNQTVARAPTKFQIRRPRTFAVDATMRVVDRERLFEIVSATEVNTIRDLLLTCEELVGEPPWQAST